MRKGPTFAVLSTWVPPHSSLENPPMPDDADALAVLLAEEGLSALRAGGLEAHDLGADLVAGEYLVVH